MSEWTKEPWRVILNARGGSDPAHWALVGSSDDLAFANGDPNHLQRAKECVNALAGISDPVAFVAAADGLRDELASTPCNDEHCGRVWVETLRLAPKCPRCTALARYDAERSRA